MALFKVCRGNETDLPSAKNDGWAYFCTDTGNFYIDHIDSSGALVRTQINASCANKLRDVDGDSFIDLTVKDIAAIEDRANTYTDNAVSQKSQVQIITWEVSD